MVCEAILESVDTDVVAAVALVLIPKFVRASAAVLAPVPPSATATSVPFQTPVVMVPSVVMLA